MLEAKPRGKGETETHRGGNMNTLSNKVLTLYILIMAIPLARIIEYVSANPQWDTIARFIMLVAIIVEWISSQASFSDDYEYSAPLSRVNEILTVILEVGVSLSAAFAAYQLSWESGFYTCMLLFFLFDLLTQFVTRTPRSDKFMYKVTQIWIRLDMLEILFFAAGIFAASWDPTREAFRSTVLATIVVSLTLADFLWNGPFFFGDRNAAKSS